MSDSENSSASAEDRLVVDVICALAADDAENGVRPLREYLARFGGHEEIVAREYLAFVAAHECVTHTDGDARTPAAAATGLARYRLLEEIGRGGQGVVYRAEDRQLDRIVALKVLRISPATGDDALLRFKREADVAGRLGHPGICAVLDAGIEPGCAYIAMRYIDGVDMTRVLAADEAPDHREIERRLVLMERVARALHAAHQQGVVHRDMKPANVMITADDVPVILDFGLARDLTPDLPTLTASGAVFGTPAYMAPEQLRGEAHRVDARTDVWALGVILHEAVSGGRPFEGASFESMRRSILIDEPIDPRRLNPRVDSQLATVIATALEKNPDRRYASAHAFAEDVMRVRTGRPILARRPGVLVRFGRTIRRHPRAAASLATSIVALLIGLAVTLAFLERERGLRQEAERQGERAQRFLRRFLQASDVRRTEELLRAEEEELNPVQPALVERAEDWLASARRLLSRRADHRAALAEITSGEGGEMDRIESDWVATLLQGALHRLDELAERVTSVEERLARARTIVARSIEAHRAVWDECIDDVASHPAYRGLTLRPQIGLVPLHADPRSELWEFLVVETGDAPGWDERNERWRIAEETGIVLVLVPEGSFMMGAAVRRGLEPAATPWTNELPVHEVSLAAFFVSKYEVTQAQWRRAMGANPARRAGDADAATKPVEWISWHEAETFCRRTGLALPTEAQWEYVCRAGTRTAWSTGDAEVSLRGFANVRGAEARPRPGRSRFLDAPSCSPFDDGVVFTATVGSYRANPFGLHDVHGNVAEWCRDVYGPYDAAPHEGRDGRREVSGTARVLRGGAFTYPATYARSSQRASAKPDARADWVGLRPVRALDALR